VFKEEFIKIGYNPMFALVEDSIVDAFVSNEQLRIFERRTNNTNIKTQILKSDGLKWLVILYIKNVNDEESLQYVLDNISEAGKIIETDKLISR
jgi:hypothetical protein